MEAEARYTRVGVAVLLLIAALVVGVLWLKNIGGKGEFKRYEIHFETQALDGLEVGGDVTLRGIKVGRVEDYALDAGAFNRVRVEVRVDARAPVRTNTVAVVTRNFVTGIAAITLVNREPQGEPLVEVVSGDRFPLIGEGRSDLDEIAGRVTKVGEMAALALNNLNQFLNAENREAVVATVRSLRDLAAGLNGRMAALDRTLRQVGAASAQVGTAAAGVDGAAANFSTAAAQLGQAGERIAVVAERGGARLDQTLAETERVLTEARRALGEVATASNAVQQQVVDTARQLQDSASNIDDQLGAALAELRLSIETATRVVDRLRDPRAALLGPAPSQLGPGEKLP